jgi:hypothetical protein
VAGMAKHDSVAALLATLGDNFIGLWRFRVFGKRRSWCVTLQVDGNYYDTLPRANAELALKDAIKTRDRVVAKGHSR